MSTETSLGDADANQGGLDNILDLDPETFEPRHRHYIENDDTRDFHKVCLQVVHAIDDLETREKVKSRLIHSVYSYYYTPREGWGRCWSILQRVLFEELPNILDDDDTPEWARNVHRIITNT